MAYQMTQKDKCLWRSDIRNGSFELVDFFADVDFCALDIARKGTWHTVSVDDG